MNCSRQRKREAARISKESLSFISEKRTSVNRHLGNILPIITGTGISIGNWKNDAAWIHECFSGE
jgi:hypothetical protein